MSELRPLAAASVTPEEDDMQRAYLKIEINGVVVAEDVITHERDGLPAWHEVVELARFWLLHEHPEYAAKRDECTRLAEQQRAGEISLEDMIARHKALMAEMEPAR